MGDINNIESLTSRCKQNIVRICEAYPDSPWNLSLGNYVERLSQIPDCYEQINGIFGYRFLIPDEHILSEESISQVKSKSDEEYGDELIESQAKNIIKIALKYIEDNYTNEELSLNDVSAFCNVSPNYFSSLFSAEMQQTFVEYVTNKRITKAKKLLKTTTLHTGEIAATVGYKDQHYFSVVFKKIQGCSPREYRNSK